MREPCFENILKVLKRQVPDRPTLFEFFMNLPLYEKLSGLKLEKGKYPRSDFRLLINAFRHAGYDYATIHGSDFAFPRSPIHRGKSISLNDGVMITDRKSFEQYPWPDPDAYDYSRLEICKEELPSGMKLIVWGPGGVLENVIALVGYDNLCYMIADEPDLAEDIFEAVGSRLMRYYEKSACYDTVGALISNDDWGFSTQTLLSPVHMRQFVFPWHKKIVEAIHAVGKPAILHSCGKLDSVIDDIIDDMKYDAKHSYEDKILPVEEAYEKWGSRIAILGGIDMDFMCRSSTEDIKQRCRAMLDRTAKKGGYALGTGNSVPTYLPDENFFAMISVVNQKQ